MEPNAPVATTLSEQDKYEKGDMKSTASVATPLSGQNKKEKRKGLAITIVVASVVAICGIGFGILQVIKNNKDINESPDISYMGKKSISELDKEQAINEYIKLQNESGLIVDSAILPSENESDTTLLYSYSDDSEILEIAMNSMNNLDIELSSNNIKIERANDYYSIISIDQDIVDCKELTFSSCHKGVSFNKKFLDYRKEEMPTEYGGISTNEIVTFTNTDKESIGEVLPILIYLFLQPGDETRSNVYDYSLEELANNYTVKVSKIGVGMNMKNLRKATGNNYYNAFSPAINLYSFSYSIDKNTGEVSSIKNEDGSVRDIVNSFNLTSDDLNYLRSKVTDFPM